MVETEDKPSGGSGCGVIIALGVLTIGILLWMLVSSSVSSLARPPVADSETFEGTVFLTRERRVLTLPVTLTVDGQNFPIDDLHVRTTETRSRDDGEVLSENMTNVQVNPESIGSGTVVLRTDAPPVEVSWSINISVEVEDFGSQVALTVDAPEDTFGPQNRRASDGDDDDRGCGETTGVDRLWRGAKLVSRADWEQRSGCWSPLGVVGVLGVLLFLAVILIILRGLFSLGGDPNLELEAEQQSAVISDEVNEPDLAETLIVGEPTS